MGHGKETPRQKMIGMMYLVLTAMLALNVSADILNAFVLVDEGLLKSTRTYEEKNNSAYASFDAEFDKTPTKVKEWREKAYQLKDLADNLAFELQDIKASIVQYADGPEAPALKPVTYYIGEKREAKQTFDVDGNQLQAKDNQDKPAEIMITNGKGLELKGKIEAFREAVCALTTDTAMHSAIRKTLDTKEHTLQDGTIQPWESSLFEHIPLAAVVTMLSKLQGDVRKVEGDMLQHLLSAIGATDTKVNKMEAVVLAKSGFVLKGEQYQARILLAAYDSLQRPEIFLGAYRKKASGDGYEMVDPNAKPLPYDEQGRAMYTATPGVGSYTLQGLLQVPGPDGIVSYPFASDYQVGEANAVISATKMNVFYIGVDNPVSISVSGVPADKVKATMTNGSLVQSGKEWIAKPSAVGKSIVTVTADGKTMGSMEYRVKTVPNPIARIAGKSGGKIDKGTLAAQVALSATMENFDFDIKVVIKSFSMTVVKSNTAIPSQSNSGRLTDAQKSQLNGLSRGNKVFFEDIKADLPGRPNTELNAIALTIE